jgi:hypothetical protein
MSKRSRRRADPSARPRPQLERVIEPVRRPGRPRLAEPVRRRRRGLLLALAAAAIGVVIVVVVVVLNRPPSGPAGLLPAMQTGAPPWLPEIEHLQARLQADGLQILTTEGQVQHTHQHLDLFVDGKAVTIPADIGIDFVTAILSPIHTHDATGIIHVESPVVHEFTLGEFFDVWGVRFDAHCVGGICDGNGRSMSVYLNGQAISGDPRAIVLDAHEEIVVAVGTSAQLPSPIPSTYAFPAGL